MSNKTSDKNVVTEEDLEVLNEVLLHNRETEQARIAIEHMLAELEQMLKERDVANDSVIAHKFAVMQQQLEQKDKRIQELEAKLEFKEFGDLDNVEFEEYMSQFIPKRDVIETLNRHKLAYEEFNIMYNNTHYEDDEIRARDFYVIVTEDRIVQVLTKLLGGEK